MKALPKRKGNTRGKVPAFRYYGASMKALPKRKGNTTAGDPYTVTDTASMKALPKRKGNRRITTITPIKAVSLNESPSEKEGKYCA